MYRELIRKSVNAGKEVTAHEAAVDFYGSSQVGYIVIDPETGAGGYLIGGGENGGMLIILGLAMILSMSIALIVSAPISVGFAPFVFESALAIIFAGLEIIGKSIGESKLQSISCSLKFVLIDYALLSLLSVIKIFKEIVEFKYTLLPLSTEGGAAACAGYF
jgi:hypothetical protein